MIIRGKQIDNRIEKLLNNRGLFTEKEIDDFLYPSIEGFYNPFLLSGMKEAVQRITQAIENNENIVIYGDYDCDGISSSAMLYLYFKSKGIEVSVFIPNRFSDGYGISESTVTEVAESFFPDLVITVDCGITAIEEVEMFKELGIDVIVTDHHEPRDILPNCIVIDPKIKNQKYPFNGLSGAGVALKLIHALSDLNQALKYIDICAVSTIGDIVPLVSENRVISSLGLSMMNSSETKPFLLHMKKMLNINEFTSTELAFKVIPRINATGRMDKSIKAFEYFVSTDKDKLDFYYNEIESDNNERLNSSTESFEKIMSHLNETGLNNNPALFIYEPTINLGIIGILASKLCNIYNRPVFILSKFENDEIKCSVRSIPGINIFEIMTKFKDLLVDVGGHELAGGLTILESNLKEFESKIQSELKKNFSDEIYHTTHSYDFEIFEKDFSIDFMNQIKMLEPFGHMNKKPVFKFESINHDYIQLKSFKHYRVLTKSKKEILSFFGNKYVYCFNNSKGTDTIVELEKNEFAGKTKIKGILKHATTHIHKIENEDELAFCKSMFYYYQSINRKSQSSVPIDQTNLLSKNYETLIIADKFETYSNLSQKYNIKRDFLPDICGRTMVLYNPLYTLDKTNLLFYKYVIFADEQLSDNQINFLDKNCSINKISDFEKVSSFDREKFTFVFKELKKLSTIPANNFIELLYSILRNTEELSLTEIAFTLLVSAELGFFNLQILSDEIWFSVNKNPRKRELSESQLYNRLKKA